MEILGIDIGGSGIKGALVDTQQGKFSSERHRLQTPSSLRPEEVLEAVCAVVGHFAGYEGPVGVGFPAVVVEGSPRTPFTAHQIKSWVGFPVARWLGERLGRPVTMLNDADAAGIAEMRFGNGRGEKGVVLILTLGTGIGSALFVDGHLLPNTEFGHIYLPGRRERSEEFTSDRIRDELDLSWEAFAARLDEFLNHVDHLFSPHLIILGGGISKKHEKYIPRLTVSTRVIPARLRNRAGIIGAATAVAEGWSN